VLGRQANRGLQGVRVNEHPLSRRAAIAGIGATEFSKDSGRSELQLAAEAVLHALDDAGLSPKDVDGISSFTVDSNDEVDLSATLGFQDVRFFSRTPYGGGGACGIVHHAAMAVATKSANVVVCFRALNERSGKRYGAGAYYRAITSSTDIHRFSWYMPFGLLTPASWIAMTVRRYMHETGVTSEDFGRVAVLLRKHAAKNPAARFYGRPITLDEHQASRWIVEPLRLLDCCLESDGAVALIVTSTEQARRLKQVPAVIAASAQGMGPEQESMTSYYGRDMSHLLELGVVGCQLWEMAGIGPGDIQAAMLYDHFTPFVLMQLEELGFCGRGEAARFVAEGNLELGGRLPINTNGGLLGEAYIHGVNNVAEAVRQIRGTSVNQVGGIANVLVTAGSGVPTSGLILSAA
jgi:acetyl-CoA acetyltransferase